MTGLEAEGSYLIESENNKETGCSFRISGLDKSYSVGRGDDCQFRVENLDISRKHLNLIVEKQSLFACLVATERESYLNGMKMNRRERYQLLHNDRIYLMPQKPKILPAVVLSVIDQGEMGAFSRFGHEPVLELSIDGSEVRLRGQTLEMWPFIANSRQNPLLQNIKTLTKSEYTVLNALYAKTRFESLEKTVPVPGIPPKSEYTMSDIAELLGKQPLKAPEPFQYSGDQYDELYDMYKIDVKNRNSAVTTTISGLRKMLERNTKNPTLIITHKATGAYYMPVIKDLR